MAQARRPFEPDADNTAVGKRDKDNLLHTILSGSLLLVEAGFFCTRSKNMDIQINGKPMTLADGISIGELLRMKDLDPASVVVEHNMAIVAADDWDRVRLQANDVLEILRFVGGG
jgi:thiamine biosynthesis protein ThiS